MRTRRVARMDRVQIYNDIRTESRTTMAITGGKNEKTYRHTFCYAGRCKKKVHLIVNPNITDLGWTASGDCTTGSSTPRPRCILSFLPLLAHCRRLRLSFPRPGIRPDPGYCWAAVFGTCKNQSSARHNI